MKLVRRSFAVALVFALAGCMSSGKEIKADQLTDLQKGKTTYSDVLAKFGPPTATTVSSDGLKIISYSHTATQVKGATFIPIVGAFAGGATGQMTVVTLTFDKDGMLHNFTSTNTNTDVSNGG